MGDKDNITAEIMRIDRNSLLSGVTLTMAGVPPGVQTAKRVDSILENLAPYLRNPIENLRGLFLQMASGGAPSGPAFHLARLEWEQARTEIRQVTLERIRELSVETESDYRGHNHYDSSPSAGAPGMSG